MKIEKPESNPLDNPKPRVLKEPGVNDQVGSTLDLSEDVLERLKVLEELTAINEKVSITDHIDIKGVGKISLFDEGVSSDNRKCPAIEKWKVFGDMLKDLSGEDRKIFLKDVMKMDPEGTYLASNNSTGNHGTSPDAIVFQEGDFRGGRRGYFIYTLCAYPKNIRNIFV